MMPVIESTQPRSAESGFTLIELVVVVAILAALAGLAFEALARRPAQARSTAVAFAALVADARALAAITSDAAGSGASIGVVRDGDAYVATLYAYRPIEGAPARPVPVRNTPPLRTATALTLVQSGVMLEPPFAVFVSASGHVSARAHFAIGSDAPLAVEPACSLATGIVIAFADGAHNQAHAISCEMARLDLDTSVADGSR